VEGKTLEVTRELADKLPFKTTIIAGEKLQEVLESVRQAYKEQEKLKAILSELSSWKKDEKKKV
jgi:predicted RNase H-like nuclease (RuvC/YqgF family)